MSKIWILIKREFKSKVFSRAFLVSTLLTPILILGFAFGPALLLEYSGEESIVLATVDYSQQVAPHLESLFSDTLVNGQPRFHLVRVPPAQFEAQREHYRKALEEGELDVLLIFPEDFYQSRQFTYMSRTVSDLDLIRLMRSRLSDFVHRALLAEAGLPPELIEELSREVSVKTVKVTPEGEKEKKAGEEFGMAFVFLFVLYFTIIFYGVAIMQGVMEEKSSRIVEILLSSTRPFQMMMGKLLGIGTAGLIQYLAWVLMALAAFFFTAASAPSLLKMIRLSPSDLFYFVLFFLIGFFMYSTLYMAAAAMSGRQEDLQTFSMPITMLIVIPFLISVTVGIQNPSGELATTLSFVPFFAPMLMFMRVVLINPPWWEVWFAILLCVATILLLVWLVSKIYRVGILMYGKRPTLPEIMRWIRYG